MRNINLDDITIPPEWINKAAKVTDELIAANNEEERKEIIDRNDNLWGEIKNILLKASYNKCWYSESIDLVSDWHVDHFRPKNRARNLDGTYRSGYWWLAFDWRNYRVVGSICNTRHKGDDEKTRGKHDFFPLRKNSKIASNPDEDVDDEEPLFLDPTRRSDPYLIMFEPDGKASPQAENDSWEYCRANETIYYFHLNHPYLRDRRAALWADCDKEIAYLKSHTINRSITQRARIEEKIKNLRKMVSRESELSATVVSCILQNGSIPLQQAILQDGE